MIILCFSLFCVCLLGLIHTYLFYPFLLKLWSKNKTINQHCFTSEEKALWPFVSILMAAHNEEKVIEEKMNSLIELAYPVEKLAIYVGSDCSSDRTDSILEQFSKDYNHLSVEIFRQRQGKPNIINALAAKALKRVGEGPNHVFILTDASVMLLPDTLYHLVKHFKQNGIVIVDAHMQYAGMQPVGISNSENQYVSKEVNIKHRESIIWQKMIGPFGGCYACRSDYFTNVPDNFLVDDFFITMSAIERGGLAINDLDAICYEPISHEVTEEFRRRSRISAGNFQNMVRFSNLWWPPTHGANFAFFSHKILRWLGPFFLLGILLAALGLLAQGIKESKYVLFIWTFLLVFVPILDFVIAKLKLNLKPLRNINYFVFMNLALLNGFFKYLKGIKSNVWQPTKRS